MSTKEFDETESVYPKKHHRSSKGLEVDSNDNTTTTGHTNGHCNENNKTPSTPSSVLIQTIKRSMSFNKSNSSTPNNSNSVPNTIHNNNNTNTTNTESTPTNNYTEIIPQRKI